MRKIWNILWILMLVCLISGCMGAEQTPETTAAEPETQETAMATEPDDVPPTEITEATDATVADAEPTEPTESEPTEPAEQDVRILRIWMEEPGKAVSVGDTLTFYVEAEFKYDPGSFVLWFKSVDNSSSIKSAVQAYSAATADNVYTVKLTVTDDMFPGEWTADWYFISDHYGSYEQKSFTDEQRQEICFTVMGEININEDLPDVSVMRIWMEDPGKSVSVGDTLTFYVEAEFKYGPDSFVLWFKSVDNSSSIKSAVQAYSAATADNVYTVKLTVTDDMFPGEWTADWYFISDHYGSYEQKSFTDEQRQEICFTVT